MVTAAGSPSNSNEDSGPSRPARLLFVSFFYPPFSSIGGLRVSKMSRYLGELGWDVRVLTVDRDDLAADLPVEIDTDRIVRARNRDINLLPKILLGRGRVRSEGFSVGSRNWALRSVGALYRDVTNFPDGQVGWYHPALAAGRQLTRTWRPDLIYSSALPATAHLVARSLARRISVPWVAEYRDPWTDSRSRQRRWPLSWLERRVEDVYMKEAAGFVTVSDAWAIQLRTRFPGPPVSVVPNGYDSTDYTPGLTAPDHLPLTLLYTGRVYPRQDITALFEAVRRLIDDRRIRSEELRIRFLGRYLSSARESAESMGLLGNVVSVEPPIPHREALDAQQRAHALVIALGADDDTGWRPAKLYEYLGARRPILMLGGTEHHEARSILNECRSGLALAGQIEIADQLEAWVTELRTTGAVAFAGDPLVIEKFERKALARRLDAILRATLDQSRATAGAQTPK